MIYHIATRETKLHNFSIAEVQVEDFRDIINIHAQKIESCGRDNVRIWLFSHFAPNGEKLWELINMDWVNC